MDYITTKELAAELGVNEQRARKLLSDGRVPGAKKHGRDWLIPADAPGKVERLPSGRPSETRAEIDRRREDRRKLDDLADEGYREDAEDSRQFAGEVFPLLAELPDD